MGFLVGLCVLAAAVGVVNPAVIFHDKDFVLGGTLRLRPVNPPTPITSITWKHQGNLLVEQYSRTDKPDTYNNRASLDFSTGELTIFDLTMGDAGKYAIDVNFKEQDDGFEVKILKEVPVPTVELKPLTCSETSADCSLHCEGDVNGAGTVSYFWKRGDQDWRESTKKIEIENDAATQQIKEFFCKVKNSVSEKESAATPNPFYKEASSSSAAAIVVPIVILIIAIIAIIAVVLTIFFKKMLCFKNCQNKTVTTERNEVTAEEGMKLVAPKEPTASETGTTKMNRATGEEGTKLADHPEPNAPETGTTKMNGATAEEGTKLADHPEPNASATGARSSAPETHTKGV